MWTIQRLTQSQSALSPRCAQGLEQNGKTTPLEAEAPVILYPKLKHRDEGESPPPAWPRLGTGGWGLGHRHLG